MSNTSKRIQRIINKISESRDSGDYTDLNIICEGVEIKVHKIILCSQSPVFRAACNGNFKEAAESAYQMIDESLPVVRRMLDFLYTGDYSEFTGGITTDAPDKEPLQKMPALQLHAQLFALGDKYCIPELCEAATEKFSNNLTGTFDPIEYLDSIPDIFFSPLGQNRGLKELAIRFSRDNLGFHLQNASVRAKYDSVAAEVPDFVKEMLDTYLASPLLEDCANCGHAKPMSALQVRCQICGRGKEVRQYHYMLKF